MEGCRSAKCLIKDFDFHCLLLSVNVLAILIRQELQINAEMSMKMGGVGAVMVGKMQINENQVIFTRKSVTVRVSR
ncbi:hypothetical protein PROAA_1350022 [Candidatus Propionivibrio aalborgensis]|uniref:Uncharacterized protein n=1 Tax=Candidatus Propionivibrio aalborgensis TaxID=1860101 RepID=A0A1A8XJB4_9RHOO|nr:hypothetical protein PROAA_1350022 [Candidatus Propionivibrio aalborgensis]